MIQNKYMLLDRDNRPVLFDYKRSYPQIWLELINPQGQRIGQHSCNAPELLLDLVSRVFSKPKVQGAIKEKIELLTRIYLDFHARDFYIPQSFVSYIGFDPQTRKSKDLYLPAASAYDCAIFLHPNSKYIRCIAKNYLYDYARVQEIKRSYAEVIDLYSQMTSILSEIDAQFRQTQIRLVQPLYYSQGGIAVHYKQIIQAFDADLALNGNYSMSELLSCAHYIVNGVWHSSVKEVIVDYESVWRRNVEYLTHFKMQDRGSAPLYALWYQNPNLVLSSLNVEIDPLSLEFTSTPPIPNASDKGLYLQVQNGKISQLICNSTYTLGHQMNLEIEKSRLEQQIPKPWVETTFRHKV